MKVYLDKSATCFTNNPLCCFVAMAKDASLTNGNTNRQQERKIERN
jgi:hypothetical protein